MEAEATKPDGIVQLQTWLEVNKKRILYVLGGVLVTVLALVVYVNLQAQTEAKAARALSEIRADRQADGTMAPIPAESYLAVANDYAGTKAASRALLLAASSRFVEGRHDEAKSLFEQFLQRYPDSPYAPQALYGVAAALDAQKQTAQAIAKYEEVRRVYPNQSVDEQAHFALARLYEKENRLEDAYAIYEEIVASQAGSALGAEANNRLQDLQERHPELVKTNALPPVPTLSSPLTLGTNLDSLSNITQSILTNASTNLPLNIQVAPPAEPTPEPAPAPVPAPAPDAQPNP